MPFESLSFRHTFHFPDIPHRWLPLIYLYDPDLPLFPLFYFHVLRNNILPSTRPRLADRAFGYVEHVRLQDPGVDVDIVVNKNLSIAGSEVFAVPVERELRERFGIANPVTLVDVANCFEAPLDAANVLLVELWHRVVANALDDRLPFGRLWDGVLGLARFVASFNSGGRKGELIQTHYFARRFGVPIQSAAGIPQLDFHLFPTASEFFDGDNPLNDFPQFRNLVRVAELVAQHYGRRVPVAGFELTAFSNPRPGHLNTAELFRIIRDGHIRQALQHSAIDCFNAFGKGPPRTVLYLLMLNDLRHGLLRPAELTSENCGGIYDDLKRISTYQSPKVIELYAQQCFGNIHAMPADIWVSNFLKWPLAVYSRERVRRPFTQIFSHARGLGKVERLIWATAQARKVHSSMCDNAVWCIKKASGQNRSRAANPLGCNICSDVIRNACPAFAAIRRDTVGFNNADPSATFQVFTSASDNITRNQSFVGCSGTSIYDHITDEFSPIDDPSGFAFYPARTHVGGTTMTVEDFVDMY